MTYAIITGNYAGYSHMFGQQKPPAAYGFPSMPVVPSILGCCGLAGISGFFGIPLAKFSSIDEKEKWADRAAWLEGMYANWKRPGHFLYTLIPAQFNHPIHKMFLEIGATELAAFPNLNYTDGHKVHLFLVNIQKAVGIYLDDNGKALKEPPKPKEEVVIVVPPISPPKTKTAVKAPK